MQLEKALNGDIAARTGHRMVSPAAMVWPLRMGGYSLPAQPRNNNRRLPKARAAVGAEIDVHPLMAAQGQDPQVVNAMGVVGVLMGVEHGVDRVDAGIEKLLAQIRPVSISTRVGRGVPSRKASIRREQRRRRLRGLARRRGPVIAYARHAARGAAAQNRGDDAVGRVMGSGQPVLLNAGEIACVSAARRSRLMPLTSASFSAVWRTKWLVGRPAMRDRREIRRVGLDEVAVGRTSAATARISSAFLKVMMPEKELYPPRARRNEARSRPAVKQWRRRGHPLPASSSRMAACGHRRRLWITRGRPVIRAAAM